MADTTVTANAGAGGSKFSVDADGLGNVWPYAKAAWGPSGTQNELDDANGKRWPVKVGDPLPAGTNAIGTVTANIGTTNGLALDATLTGGSAVAIVKGGAKGTTAAAVLTSNPIDANTQALHVDGSKVTQPVSGTFWQATQPVSGTVTANQGTANTLANKWPVQITDGTNTMPTGDAAARTIHVTADNASIPVTQSGTWTVQPGNTQNTTPWLVAPQAIASGGCSVDSYLAAASANQDQHAVKAGAGMLYGLAIYNHATAERFVKVYNVASPTSASTPVLRIGLPANTTGSGNNIFVPVGAYFNTQIAIRITTGIADNDATAVTANDVIVNSFYQ